MRSTHVALCIWLLSGCVAREADPPVTAAIAGEWRAPSDYPDLENTLQLDEDGDGDATIYRWTSALFKLGFVVTAEADADDELRFMLTYECPPEIDPLACERFLFTAPCDLDGEELHCDAPDWYGEDWIAYARADSPQ
jgi:hypothetical protein